MPKSARNFQKQSTKTLRSLQLNKLFKPTRPRLRGDPPNTAPQSLQVSPQHTPRIINAKLLKLSSKPDSAMRAPRVKLRGLLSSTDASTECSTPLSLSMNSAPQSLASSRRGTPTGTPSGLKPFFPLQNTSLRRIKEQLVTRASKYPKLSSFCALNTESSQDDGSASPVREVVPDDYKIDPL